MKRLQITEAEYEVAPRGTFRVAGLRFMFLFGRLAMPTLDVRCMARHVFFSRLDAAMLLGDWARKGWKL